MAKAEIICFKEKKEMTKTKGLLKRIAACVLVAAMTVSSAACGNSSQSNNTVNEAQQYSGKLEFDHSVEFKYADNVSIDCYKGGYRMIKINENDPILVVPEGMQVPSGLDSDVYVLQRPLTNMLISSTPTMSLINAIDCLDSVALTTTDVSGWYIDNVKTRMEAGSIKYVGSASEPDYELMAASGVNFAIFSSGVSEDVTAKLKQLGIHLVIDQSNVGSHPLARVEWIKVYGAIFDKEDAANKAFEEQEKLVNSIDGTKTGKSVAVFYITSKGVLYARNAGDYMAKMVTLAGGDYILDGKVGVGKTGNEKMEPEAFYSYAKDADVIIYVWSMGGKPATLSDFVARSSILGDMKAVKEGNVWCTTPDFFQTSATIGNIISDINKALNADAGTDSYDYLFKLK